MGSTPDITDLECLYDYLSTQKATGNYQNDLPLFCAAADVNGDGTVNILDYQYLYKRIVMSEE